MEVKFYLAIKDEMFYNDFMDKIKEFFKNETEIFNSFVASPNDVKVSILNTVKVLKNLKRKNPAQWVQLKKYPAWVQISITNGDSTIKFSGCGNDIYSAFYSAKNKLSSYLLKMSELAEQESSEIGASLDEPSDLIH